MTDAPYHGDITDGPASGYARWVTAPDGVRLRLGFWPLPEAKGTVLIFTGRTEYIEKYGHVASALHAAGYAVASLDWRGQGLSDRLMDDAHRGHISSFGDYQKDVQCLLSAVKAENMPAPYALIAHSMGGAIGLRALLNGLPVSCAVFSAPMWGILLSPLMRPMAWLASRAAAGIGKGGMLAPGTSQRSFILNDPFEDNTLTRDPHMWAHMGEQIKTVPALELGGPSLDWVREATTECAALASAPAPKVPTLTFLGANERIVDSAAVQTRMRDWPAGKLVVVPDAEHEVLMEVPAIRADVLRQIIAHLDAHQAS